jgi:hypothetical protein
LQDTRKLGRIQIAPQQLMKDEEPIPFDIQLPVLSHILDIVRTGDFFYLHFWYWGSKSKVILQGRSARWEPYETLTLLQWHQGRRYSGPIGTFLKTVQVDGEVTHFFDLTRYNDATGEVLGRFK